VLHLSEHKNISLKEQKDHNTHNHKPAHILDERFKTGIIGFDKLLRKGIPKSFSVLVEGGPGSGKTVFCLQTLKYACEQNQKCLYMSFEEPSDRLISHMKMFGWDPEIYIKKGILQIKNFNALDISRSVEALLSEAKKELLIDVQPILIPEDFEPDLIVIDSLSSISSAFSGEGNRFRIYMEQLFKYLERNKITSFLIRETPLPSHLGLVMQSKTDEVVSFLSDGIIAIYNTIATSGKRGRAIEVVKMRGVDIDRRIVPGEITSKGWVVESDKTLSRKDQFQMVLT
jgi:circadian clock protein KaiC